MKVNEMKTGKSVADLGLKYEGGHFYCGYKKLTSLEGSPQKVDDDFYCHENDLTSLEGAPQEVGGNFWCNDNKLTSLKGAPQKVGGNFWCDNNNLTSLEGAPRQVGNSFHCTDNKLTSLEGAPQEVGGNFWCDNNKNLTSLKDIHKFIHRVNGEFDARGCPIQSHVLGLLLIKDLKKVVLSKKRVVAIRVAAIINAHLDGGSMKSALDCQHALIKAGFLKYAKL